MHLLIKFGAMTTTLFMTTYSFGDIALVAFPFTNLQATKKRPVVVISNMLTRPDIILMAITSQIKQPLEFGEYLLAEWQQAGLPKASVIKPLVATIEQKQIIKSIGRLSPVDQKGLEVVLAEILTAL